MAIRKFAELILAGEEVPIFGDGSLRRDYTYIDDIVDGILLALDFAGKFEVFNLGNSHPVRIDEMVEILAAALGKPVRRRFLPTPSGEMPLTHADVNKAHQGLGYAPRVGFAEGVMRFATWLRNRENPVK